MTSNVIAFLVLLVDTSDEMANLRPESREITLDEEKAMVLEEMRKLSENSQDPPV